MLKLYWAKDRQIHTSIQKTEQKRKAVVVLEGHYFLSYILKIRIPFKPTTTAPNTLEALVPKYKRERSQAIDDVTPTRQCGRPLKCLRAFRHVICWVELLYRFSKRLDFDLNRRTLNSIHQTDFWRFQPGVHFNWINFPWSINPEIETIKMGGLWIITGSTHIFHETLMRTYWNKRLLVASELFEPKKLIRFFNK